MDKPIRELQEIIKGVNDKMNDTIYELQIENNRPRLSTRGY